MKKIRFTKIMIATLILLASLCLYTFASAAYEGVCGEHLSWTLDDQGVLTIFGTGDMDHFGADESPWRNMKGKIKRIILQEGVTSIGSYAFAECSNLKNVDFPAGIIDIGKFAFYKCRSLKKALLKNGLQRIGESAFEDCQKLLEAHVPGTVVTIGEAAFRNCGLETIAYYPTIDIVDYLFEGCKNLKQFRVPEGVKTIKGIVFRGCTALKKVILPASVKEIYPGAFFDCINLSDVYYAGSEEQRALINIMLANVYLENATWHYHNTSGEDLTPESIQICGSHYVARKKSIQLTAKVFPEGADQSVVWRSMDSSIAEVNDQGIVCGKKAGTVRISACSKSNMTVIKSFKINVMKKAISWIEIKGAIGYMKPGEKVKLKVNMGPKDAALYYTWHISDPKVGTVNADDVFTARKKGTVDLEAVAVDGSGKKAKVTIIVSDLSTMETIQKAKSEYEKQKKKYLKGEKNYITQLTQTFDNAQQDVEKKIKSTMSTAIKITDKTCKDALCWKLYDEISIKIKESSSSYKDCKTPMDLIRKVAGQLVGSKGEFSFTYGSGKKKITYEVEYDAYASLGSGVAFGKIRQKGGKAYSMIWTSTYKENIQEAMDNLKDFAESKIKEVGKALIKDSISLLEYNKVIDFFTNTKKDNVIYSIALKDLKVYERLDMALIAAKHYRDLVKVYEKVKDIDQASVSPDDLAKTIENFYKFVKEFKDSIVDLL